MIWQDLHHAQLSVGQLYQILRLRSEVFVIEQQCLYQDMDGQDLLGENRHVFSEEEGNVLTCARILAPANVQAGVAIGRVVVAPQARGRKLGVELMTRAVACCHSHWPGSDIILSAQAHLQNFYRGLGFHACGDIYLEDNIPHIEMKKWPDKPATCRLLINLNAGKTDGK